MKERNLKCELKETVNGFEIYRCEAKNENIFTGELSGQTKVYYDVVYDDNIVDSFKTLSKARLFAKNYWN